MDKHLLQEYCNLLAEIENREAERARIIASICSPKAPDGLPHGSGISDPTGTTGARLATLRLQIDMILDKVIALRIEIEASIAALPSADRELMRLRYIDGYNWDQVVEKIYGNRKDFNDPTKKENYTRYVYRDHARILNTICQ